MDQKLIQLLGLDPKATDEQIIAAVIALQTQLAEAKATVTRRDADEKIIIEKMSHGLTREQAIGVIQRQRKFDDTKKTPVRKQP